MIADETTATANQPDSKPTTKQATKCDPEKTKMVREVKHERPLTSCHWDPKGRYVFFGAEDNSIHRLELASGNLVHLARHDSWVRALGSSIDGEKLFTAGYDGRLISWPAAAAAPEPLQVVDAHQGWVRALAVSPDGKQLATCGNDRLVKLWNTSDCGLIRTLEGHASHVYNLTYSADGQTLYSCDLHGHVKAWSSLEGQPARDVARAETLVKYDTTFRADIGGARSIALKPDGTQLALGGIINVSNAFAGVGEIAIVLVDVSQSKVALQLEAKDKVRGAAWGVAYHPEAFWIGLAGGGGGGWLYFWKGDVAHEFFKLKLKTDGRGMSMSPNSTEIAVAHSDMHLRIYSLLAA